MADGYIARHWRGELTLPVSFWLNNVALPLPVGFAIGAFAAWITVTGDYLRGGSIAVLVCWPLLLIFSAWCWVGAWRSATMHSASGGSSLWAGLAKLSIALGVLGTGATTLIDFVPNIGPYLRMARGIDPIGNVTASVSPDGRKLVLDGPLGLGDAQRVRAMAAKAPALKTVELNSPGGRLKVGEEIAALVKKEAWTTRTTGACQSACTFIHMAGTKKQLLPGAKIGFHRASSGSMNPVLERLANYELVRMYREAGLPEHFIERTLATPPWGMWHPSRDELVGAGLVSLAERPLDIDLPENPKAPAGEYADAMTGSDAWLALDKRTPGTMAKAAQVMAQARATGAEAAEVQVRGQRIVQEQMPGLLADAGPELRDGYLALWTAQLASARSLSVPPASPGPKGQTGPQVRPAPGIKPDPDAPPPACIAVLAGDAAARRALGIELVRREAAWLIAAVGAEPTREVGGRTGSAVELEVLRRRLGEKSPALLAQAWQPGELQRGGRDALRECDRMLELLRAVAALPGPERRLATRLMFGRSS
jgi:hypothetical protein